MTFYQMLQQYNDTDVAVYTMSGHIVPGRLALYSDFITVMHPESPEPTVIRISSIAMLTRAVRCDECGNAFFDVEEDDDEEAEDERDLDQILRDWEAQHRHSDGS